MARKGIFGVSLYTKESFKEDKSRKTKKNG